MSKSLVSSCLGIGIHSFFDKITVEEKALKSIDYEINIMGLKTKKGSISISALKEIVDALLKSSDRVLRLFVEGQSIKKGKNPEWLKKSLDFTVTGIKTGSTTLELEAPLLKESIPAPLLQKKLTDNLLNPDDTAISLLSKSISDVIAGSVESDYIDAGVVEALLYFGSITQNYSRELRISSGTKKEDNFNIGSEEIKKIRQVKIEAPKSNTIVITGFLNLIEHSKQRFQLTLEDGRSVEGTVDSAVMDFGNMRELWGHKVTIKGQALYKPSGKLRSIKARLIRPFEPGEEILQAIPKIKGPRESDDGFLREKSLGTRVFKRIWGKWPGDESIDELLNALKCKVINHR